MTQVETFEVTEATYPEQPDVDAESIKLIESMGLSGQENLLTAPDNGDLAILPYREMTREEAFIYNTICPERTPVENFSAEPIPLRVLQVLSHAKSLNHFDRIEVWHSPPATVKDPVLVGKKVVNYDRHYYILARWGAELAPIAELAEKALGIWRGRVQRQLSKAISAARAAEAALESATIADALEGHGYELSSHRHSLGW